MAEATVRINGQDIGGAETGEATRSTIRKGISFPRYFSSSKVSPYDQVEWELRTASIANEKGKVIFEQRNVEAPKSWSQTATNIVASKYLHGKLDTPERESSVRQMVSRVVDTITGWGLSNGYFSTPADGENFRDDLAHLMLYQKASFNSPVFHHLKSLSLRSGRMGAADGFHRQ